MISFGYGLTACLNELISLPLQGLTIRVDKLAGSVVVGMLLLPIVLLTIAKSIGVKKGTGDVDFGAQPRASTRNLFKYFLMLAGIFSIGYLGYSAVEGESTDNTYDMYVRSGTGTGTGCATPFNDKPLVSFKFSLKRIQMKFLRPKNLKKMAL